MNAMLAPRLAQIAIEHTDEAVAILVSEAARVVFAYVNPAFERMFGYRSCEVLGRPAALLSKEGQSADAILRLRFDSGSAAERGEALLVTREGTEILTEVNLRIVDLDGEVGGLLVLRDVTDFRRLEHIAGATAVSESVGYVFAGLRHELGNPLNSLKAALHLLTDETLGIPEEVKRDYLARCIGEVKRMEHLLNQMRTFNTNEVPTLATVELKPFLERFARLAKPTCEERRVDMDLDVTGDISARADPRLLQQILLILLSNAIDALHDEGPRSVSVRAVARGRRCVISLHDTGRGMTEEQLATALRPFMSTKTKGTGLGLPLARKYAGLTRCALDITSTVGVGTTCTLDLERVDSSEGASF